MRPIFLATDARNGDLRLLKNGLLVPFAPDHPHAQRIVDGWNSIEELAALRPHNQQLREALELAEATIVRLAQRHGPFSSSDGTMSVIRAALDNTKP